MKNLHLNFFHISMLIFGLLFVSCKQDSASKIKDIAQVEATSPAKKISEQYSSPEQVVKKETAEPILTNLKDEKDLVENQIVPTKVAEAVTKQKVAVPVARPVKKAEKKPVQKRYPELTFDSLLYDFGEILQGDKIEHKFTFTNTGKAPLTITKADATCGCAVPSIPFIDIMPGETGYIGIMYNSVGKEGEEYPEVTIFSNAKTNPNQVLKLKGFVKAPEKEVEKVDSIKSTATDTSKTEVGKSF